MADVRIPQVEELLGTSAATTIRLFQEYVKNDFDGATGVFAEIAKPKLPMTTPTALDGMDEDTLGVEFSSDKAGGFATPNLGVSTLTRSLGPLAGDAEDAVTDKFDPAKLLRGRHREALRQLRPRGAPPSRLSRHRTPRSCGPTRAVMSS